MLCCQNLIMITRAITALCNSVEAVVVGWNINELGGFYDKQLRTTTINHNNHFSIDTTLLCIYGMIVNELFGDSVGILLRI